MTSRKTLGRAAVLTCFAAGTYFYLQHDGDRPSDTQREEQHFEVQATGQPTPKSMAENTKAVAGDAVHGAGCTHCEHAHGHQHDHGNSAVVKSESSESVARIALDKEVRDALLNHQKGEHMEFTLPNGERAMGVVEVTKTVNGKVVALSGKLSAPKRGRFYFQEELEPGVAGEFSGGVDFEQGDVAYSVETNSAGVIEFVEKSTDEVICRTYAPLSVEQAEEEQPEQIMADHPTDVFIPAYQNGVIPLQSLPTATAVAYLDFDGEQGPFISWGDFNAAPSGSSNAQIKAVWERIAEDFAPFNINVTTDLQVYLNAPANSRIQCIFTPTTTAAPGTGGVAFVGDFNRTLDRPCWCFYTSGKSAVEAASHEIGHTLGLTHDGRISPSQGYYGGHGSGDVSWAPVMGVGYSATLTQWSKGEYLSANNQQDDLAIIVANNNVGYRADDHGETLATASNLEISSDNSVRNEGVVETRTDFDSFKFKVTATSSVSLNIAGAANGPNLDILAEIVDSSGAVVILNNPDAGNDASISTSLSAGEYFLRVSGVGRGSVTGDGYSDYGSLGEYVVTGSVTNAVVPDRFSINENLANGSAVGTVTPDNNHGANPLTFAIANGNSSGAFAINASTGQITVADSSKLDYEALSAYFDDPATFDLSVSVTDTVNSGLDETLRVVVTVLDLNEAPVMASVDTTLTVPERLAVGTVLWQVSASDQDYHDGLVYSISSGNGAGHFTIDGMTGEVKVNAVTDGATVPSYTLTITATDDGSPSLSDSVTLTLNVVDFDSQYSTGSLTVEYFDGISGNNVADFTGASAYPNSPDEASTLSSYSYTTRGSNYGGVTRGFLMAPATGSYTFWIASDDASELYLSSDSNPANAVLIASAATATGEQNWTQIASQQSVTQSLVAGQLYYIETRHKSGTGPDHLAVAWQGPGISQQVISAIYIAPDYKNYAPVLQDAELDFPTGYSNGMVVHSLSVSDANTADTVGGYSIISGNTNNAFSINSTTGVISIANAAGLVDDTDVVLQIQCSDNGSPVMQGACTVTIHLKDYLVFTGFESADNFVGSSAGTALTTTVDRLGATWSTSQDASILTGTSPAMVGNQLAALGWQTLPGSMIVTIPGVSHGVGNVKFHYSSYSSATNVDVAMYYRVDGGAWVQAWTTHMSGLNPSYLSKPWPEASVDVNQSGDVDLKFEVTGSAKGVFLDEVRVLGFNDLTNPTLYEAQAETTTSGTVAGAYDDTSLSDNTYEVLTEELTSGGAPSTKQSFLEHRWTYNILKAGSAVNLEVEAFHSANSENDDFVFAYSTDGTNYTDLLTVTKTADDDSVQTASLPSNLTGTVYIRVKDTDRTSGNSVQDSLSVDYMRLSVVPVNVAPVVSDATVSIAENAAIGSLVKTIDFSDLNGLDTHTLAITSGNAAGVFTINNSGELTTVAALDYESVTQYVLGVSATDQGGLSDSATITINVTDILEQPSAVDDTLVVQANAGSTASTVLSNDISNSTQSSSIRGIVKNVALYNAGTSGAPTSPVTQGWTEQDSEDANVNTGNATAVGSVNDNGSGLDAWVVTDHIDGAGFITYTKVPTAAQISAGNANGWYLQSKMRMIDDYADTESVVILYGNGSRRFLVFFDLDSNGDLTANLLGTGGGVYTLTSGGTGNDHFHDIAINYDATSAKAAFIVDGKRYDTGAWTGEAHSYVGFQFGNGTSGGQGSAAFHKVQLDVFETLSTLASGATVQLQSNELYYNPNGAHDALEVGDSANESVTYAIENGTGFLAMANLAITVNGVDDLPAFDSDPIAGAGATLFEPYSGTLASYGGDPDPSDTSTFGKVSGPSWLSVAADGTLSGTPSSADVGMNSFNVTVSDGKGNSSQAVLEITVASSAALLSENFQSYDVENPSDFSIGNVATGNWTSSNTATNATRIFDTSNFGATRLWISNVDGTAITSKGMIVGSYAHYSMSAVLVVETAGVASLNARYDILVGQTAATATSIIGGEQAVIARGDNTGTGTTGSKADHIFTHNFQTGAVNPGDKLFVRYKRVSGSGWFGVDDVQVNLVSGNRLPVVTPSTFAVDENSAPAVAVGTVLASDADTNDSVSLSITGGNAAGHFTINSSTGAISTTAVALDYEGANSHALTVTATDLCGQSSSGIITVNVNNLTTGDDGSNGLNDDWEVAYYGSAGSVSATDDTDGDGLNTFQEMAFGTNPTSTSMETAYLKQAVIDDAGTEKLELRVRRPLNYASLGVTYQLTSSSDLVNWQNDGTAASSVTADADGVTEWVSYRFTLGAQTKTFIKLKATKTP